MSATKCTAGASDMVALLKMPNPFARAAGPDQGADRRMFPRKEVNARIDGLRHDHTIAAHRQPQLSLHLRDLSLGGLSAISQTPLDSGEKLTVFFPPQGTKRGWDAYGRVLRCEPSGFGYRVAVEFDPIPAAA